MPIRKEAAEELARRLMSPVRDLTGHDLGPSIIKMVAQNIVLAVEIDELKQGIEQKESVIKLLGGNNGN